MAPRRRAAAAAAAPPPPPAEEEEQEEEEAGQEIGRELVKLQFKEELKWPAGKPINTTELLRRLERLSKELCELEQDGADLDSLVKVEDALAQRNLINHKDKGVRAYTACCAVDLLRIRAPDPPFAPDQLRMILGMIIQHIIPALADPAHPYSTQHRYILKSLAEVKSIVLLLDVADADELTLRLFSSLFDAVSDLKQTAADRMPKDVMPNALGVMVALFDESPGVPAPVIEVVMAQFLRVAPPGAGARSRSDRPDHLDGSQSTLLLKEEPAAYTLAKELCESCEEKMARYVGQYFGDILLESSSFALDFVNEHQGGGGGGAGGGAGKGAGGGAGGGAGDRTSVDAEDVDEDAAEAAAAAAAAGGDPTEEDAKNLDRVHMLIRELWRAAPEVLPNVVSQVEMELSTDSPHLRQIATETIGNMVCGIGAAGPPPPPNLDPRLYPPAPVMADDSERLSSSQRHDHRHHDHHNHNQQQPAPQPAPQHRRQRLAEQSALTKPSSQASFHQAYPGPYEVFMTRRNDRVSAIRAAWATAAGRILATNGGGMGLGEDEQAALVEGLCDRLNDNDDKVRLAAVRAIEFMSVRDVVTILGKSGGVDQPGSALASLADRCRDRRAPVRVEAMVLLAKLWAAATAEIAAGHEAVTACLAGIPTRLLNVFYANDPDLYALLERATFDCLVPLNFPKRNKTVPSLSHSPSSSFVTSRPHSGAAVASASASSFDPDRIRANRILLLFGGLDAPAKKAFFAIQFRQRQLAQVIETFVQQCEMYNGGTVVDADPRVALSRLDQIIKYIAVLLPDPAKAKHDLTKYAKANSRRSYHLVRFAISRDSDYGTVIKAMKEIVRSFDTGGKLLSAASAVDTIITVLYRSASLMFNKSHLPTFMELSRATGPLATAAHEILNEISLRHPDRFKNYAGQLCRDIIENAPTERVPNGPGVVDDLRSCSFYARSHPADLPADRAFPQRLMAYALYGRPDQVSTYATKILMSLCSEKKRRTASATNLLDKIMREWRYGGPHFLNRLAAVGQLERSAPDVTLGHRERIDDMVIETVLLQSRTAAGPDTEPGLTWVEDAEMDEELQAKLLALKLLCNRLRPSRRTMMYPGRDKGQEGGRDRDKGGGGRTRGGSGSGSDLGGGGGDEGGDDEAYEKERTRAESEAKPVLALLRNILTKMGEICTSNNNATPGHHRSRLRLCAAQLWLKLATERHLDDMFTPADFNLIAFVAQDPVAEVRIRFVEKLQKYLGRRMLRPRFYTVLFLTAYEREADFKAKVETWIRSMAHGFEMERNPVMETTMPRLLSLLAHHPDYDGDLAGLTDHARYLIYYVRTVATEANFPLIRRFAERTKQTRDGISPGSEKLYVLCDLALVVLDKWQERRGWTFKPHSAPIGLPAGLFTPLSGPEEAQRIAKADYLPPGVADKVIELIRALERKKKRKSIEDGSEQPSKKAKKASKKGQPGATSKHTKSAKINNDYGNDNSGSRKLVSRPKPVSAKSKAQKKGAGDQAAAAAEPAERRRSGRSTKKPVYAESEHSDEEEEEEEEGGPAGDDTDDADDDHDDDDDKDKGNSDSSELSEPGEDEDD